MSIVDKHAVTRHVARPAGDTTSNEVCDQEVDDTDKSALEAQGLSEQQHVGLTDVPSVGEGHDKTKTEEVSTGQDVIPPEDSKSECAAESTAQSADGAEGASAQSLQVVSSGKPEDLASPIHYQHNWVMTSGFTCVSCKALFDYENILKSIILTKEKHIHVLLIALLVVWAGFLMWLLSSTAQSFFVPPLIYWASRLKMRPELAGATLLALGNGAPDLFAASAAVEAEDLPLALSELVGANVFALCITSGAVILTSKDLDPNDSTMHIQVDQFKECIFGYTLALFALAYIFSDGRVTVLEAGIMQLLYLLYVAMVYIRGASSSEAEPDWHRDRNPDAPAAAERDSQFPNSLPDAPSTKTSEDELERQASVPQHEYTPLEGLERPVDSDFLETCFFVLAWPAYLIRCLSIPPSDGYWDRTRRMICVFCPTGLWIFLLSTGVVFDGIPDFSMLAVIFGMSSLAGGMLFLMSDDGPQLPWFYPVITLTAMIVSIIWLGVISNELTAIVEACGQAFRVTTNTLGFTVVGWGNAAGDLLTCMAMARRNQSRAAFAAVLAGPLFDDLVGLGLALLLAAHSRGGVIIFWEASWPKNILPPLIAGLVMLMVAVGILFAMVIFDEKMKSRNWAWALFVCYGVFFSFVIADT